MELFSDCLQLSAHKFDFIGSRNCVTMIRYHKCLTVCHEREANLTGKSPSEESAHANIILCLNFARLFIMKSGKLWATNGGKQIGGEKIFISPFYDVFLLWSISDDGEKRILNVFADSRQVVSQRLSENRCSQQIKVLKPRFEKFNLPKDVLMPERLINFCLRRLILVQRRLCINNDGWRVVRDGKVIYFKCQPWTSTRRWLRSVIWNRKIICFPGKSFVDRSWNFDIPKL